MTTLFRSIRATAFAIWVALVPACNSVGDCPAPADIVPGSSCSGDSLQCPYTLQSPSPACDGTSIDGGVATSCVCTSGSWVCPSAVACSSEGGGGDSADELESVDAGGDAVSE